MKPNKERLVPRLSTKFRSKKELGEKYVVDYNDKRDIKTRIRDARLSGKGIPENWRANRIQDLRAYKQEILLQNENVKEQWDNINPELKQKVQDSLGLKTKITPQEFVQAMPKYVEAIQSTIKNNTREQAKKDALSANKISQEKNVEAGRDNPQNNPS